MTRALQQTKEEQELMSLFAANGRHVVLLTVDSLAEWEEKKAALEHLVRRMFLLGCAKRIATFLVAE